MPIFNFHSWSSLLNTSSQLVILRWSPDAAYIGTIIAGKRRERKGLRNKMLKNSNFVSGAKRRDDEIFSTEMEVEEDAESLNSEWEDFEEISNNSVFGRVSTRERKTRKVRNKSRALLGKSSKSKELKEEQGQTPSTVGCTLHHQVLTPIKCLLLSISVSVWLNSMTLKGLKYGCL